jgi:hypothetical protein
VIGWSLAALSVLWGLATFWVFRHFADSSALRIIRRRIHAHLLGIRLFSDDPALVWRAQKALIADNLRFLKLMALPVLILGVPFALCYVRFDAIYGFHPLETGRSSVLTLHGSDVAGELRMPRGIAVETPPVRDFKAREVSWRIRPSATVRGSVTVILPGGVVARNIAAGDRTLSPNWLREPATGVLWLEVDYPRADIEIAGLALPWLAWFLILSSFSGILFTISPRRGYLKEARRPTSYPIRAS